jgi:uncharacterized membrane protein YfcA
MYKLYIYMNSIVKYIISALIGSFVGFIGGFQGIAGGFYILMLLLATGLVDTERQAAGTTLLAIIFPISAGAVYEYYKSGDVDFTIGLIITFFYAIFSTYGARYSKTIPEKWINLSLGIIMFLTSFYFIHRFYKIQNKK